MRPVIARFSPVDWLVTAALLGLIAFESAQILGLFRFNVGLWPTFLGTAAILGGILWVASPGGRTLSFGWMEAALLAGALAIVIGGLLLMPSMDPSGAGLTFMVVLGFLIVGAAGYVMYRVNGAFQLQGLEETPVVIPVFREEVSDAELATIDIFRGFSIEERRTVGLLGRRVMVSPETVLATAPQATSNLYAILSGQAEMHAASPIGEVTVRIAGAGESFPLATLVGSGQVITSARAMTDMEVIVFPTDKLRDFCQDSPEIGRKVYTAVAGVLAERYRSTLGRMTTSMQEALKGADFWPTSDLRGVLMTYQAEYESERWKAMAELPEEEQKGESRRFSESLASLDDAERQREIKETMRQEHELPDDRLFAMTRSRLLAWLDMDQEAAKKVAASYNTAMRSIPGTVAMRQTTAIQTVTLNLSEEQIERLYELMPSIIRQVPHLAAHPAAESPEKTSVGAGSGHGEKRGWAFWRKAS